MRLFLAFTIMFPLLWWSCSKDDDNDVDPEEFEYVDIHEYANEHFPGVDSTESGMYIIVTHEGTGPYPEEGEEIFVYYTSYLLTETPVDTLRFRRQPDWYVPPVEPVDPGENATEEEQEAYEKSMEEYHQKFTSYQNLSNRFKLFSFVYQTGNVTPDGFHEGFGQLRKGSKAVFLIPARLAYGASRVDNIPPYSPMRFDVELVNVK